MRHLVALDGLTVPLGVIGAAAGWMALAVGVYTLPLLLVPAAFVPEWWLSGLRDWAAGGSRSPPSTAVRDRVRRRGAVRGADRGARRATTGCCSAPSPRSCCSPALELGPGSPPGVPSMVGVLAMAPVVAVGGRTGALLGVAAAVGDRRDDRVRQPVPTRRHRADAPRRDGW